MAPTRRTFLAGLGGAAGLAALSACGSDGSTEQDAARSGSTSGRWTYTDDLGKKIDLPQPPKRIVAYVSGAAALWDFGVRPTAVYGPTRDDDGKRSLLAGSIELDDVESVGDDYEEFQLEKLRGLRPDLVIASLNGRTAASRWVIKDTIAKRIEETCPVYSIQEAYAPLPDVIASYGRLAARLGGKVDSTEVTSARKRFTAAGQALQTALRDKPDLRAQFVYADPGAMYVASPKFYANLMWYRELGMTIARQDDKSDEFLKELSWERADYYPSDLILTDIRAFSLPQQRIISDHPTFARLPAVRAKQLGGWNGEPRFSYQQAVDEVSKLAAAVRGASRLKIS